MGEQQAPSLVERLNNECAHEGETVAMIMVRWNAERKEAAARITELEGRLHDATDEVGIARQMLGIAEERAERAEADVAALTKALTGLTCGGSEFFVRRGDGFIADVDACVAWVRRSKEDAHRRTLEAIQARLRAEAQCRVLEAAQEAVSALSGDDHERGCDGRNYECSCGYDARIDEAIHMTCQALSLSGGGGEGEFAENANQGLPESPSADAGPYPRSHDEQRSDGGRG